MKPTSTSVTHERPAETNSNPVVISSAARDPAAEHRSRLAARQQALAARERTDALVANVRLAVFIALVAAGWLWLRGTLDGLWVLAPLAAFGVLLVVHERVLRAKALAKRAIAFHERALARIELQCLHRIHYFRAPQAEPVSFKRKLITTASSRVPSNAG